MDPRVPSSRPGGRGLLLVLAALTAIAPATVDVYLPAFPQIATDLRTTASGVQLTLTASLIGLGLGQLVLGPLSDRYGRRRPLLFGMAAFSVASLACALAPTAGMLLAGRFVQSFAGAAGLVISRAVIRDLYSGVRFARFTARLMLVAGIAPIVAPSVGTGLLRLGDWRALFGALTGFGLVLLLAVLLLFRETLPVERRSSGGLAGTADSVRTLLSHRNFVCYGVGGALGMAALFAYIGGFSFVTQDMYGSSQLLFSALVALNALGFVAAGQLAAHLAARVSLRRLVLADHADVAGAAAAITGTAGLLVGAAAAPLVGLGGGGTAVPLGIVIAVLSLGALVVQARSTPAAPAPEAAGLLTPSA